MGSNQNWSKMEKYWPPYSDFIFISTKIFVDYQRFFMTKSSVLWNFYSKKMNVSQCFMPKEYPELPAGATAKLHEVRNASILSPK